MADVQLECKPALEVIDLYGRAGSSLLYVDPPYLSSTRRSRQYIHEMDTDADHHELAEHLTAVSARVALSGYPSHLYDRLYHDWERIEIPASTQQGSSQARTEVLWLNYTPTQQLLPMTYLR